MCEYWIVTRPDQPALWQVLVRSPYDRTKRMMLYTGTLIGCLNYVVRENL